METICTQCGNPFRTPTKPTEERFLTLCSRCRYKVRTSEQLYTRNCPSCSKAMVYRYIGDYNKAVINNSNCKSCMTSTGKFKQGCIPNKIPVYDCWVTNYGKDKADQLFEELKTRRSLNSKGENNPMYGRPAPIGSGNGWSGWYKDWYFRSLLELSYMIMIIERFGLIWEPAEQKSLTIEYLYDGNKRSYRADFLIGEKYLVECKPKKLQNTPVNKAKAIAAKKYCEENSLIYKITHVSIVDEGVLLSKYLTGDLTFIDKYDKRFKQRNSIP